MQTTVKIPTREGRPERVNWDVGVAHGEGSATRASLDGVGDQQRPLPPDPQRSTDKSQSRVTAEPRLWTLHCNILDIAGGILLGLAAGKMVSSFVNDILLPPIGQLVGGVNFVDLFWVLDKSKGEVASLAKAREAGLSVVAYGQSIGTVLDFLVVAACVLIAIKWFNSVRRQNLSPTASPATIKTCAYCCSAIPMRATRCPFCTSVVK